MKKLIAFALSLVMAAAMSVTAFAADTTIDQNTGDKTGNTEVKFTVAPTYTVTIPAEVTLQYDSETNTYKNDGEISTGAIRLGYGKSITVAVSGDFEMTSAEEYDLSYAVKVGDSDTAIKTGDTVATFRTSTDDQRVTLHYSAANPDYAGNYTDTLTFTITAPALETND